MIKFFISLCRAPHFALPFIDNLPFLSSEICLLQSRNIRAFLWLRIEFVELILALDSGSSKVHNCRLWLSLSVKWVWIKVIGNMLLFFQHYRCTLIRIKDPSSPLFPHQSPRDSLVVRIRYSRPPWSKSWKWVRRLKTTCHSSRTDSHSLHQRPSCGIPSMPNKTSA